MGHSIATMQRVLREDAGSIGLVTANGGFLTKHALGLYSTEPPPLRLVPLGVGAGGDRRGRLGRAERRLGRAPVTVEAATVMHDRDGAPENGILLTRTADDRRAWGTTTDADAMKLIVAEEPVGRTGSIGPEGQFDFT